MIPAGVFAATLMCFLAVGAVLDAFDGSVARLRGSEGPAGALDATGADDLGEQGEVFAGEPLDQPRRRPPPMRGR